MGIGLWLACLVAPQPGLAKISCQRGSDGAVFAVSVTEGTFATVHRSGEKIVASDPFTGKKGCRAGATVTNVDQIKLFAGSNSSIFIQLVNGPFAPGLSAEEDAAPEIEFEASGPGYVEVIGSPRPEHFRFMDSGPESGVNLNPDEDGDLDLAVVREFRETMLFVVGGGAGGDRIDAAGTPTLEMFASGGDGNDTLVSPSNGAILEGERGADRFIGGPGFDYIVPGRGADRVMAAGGSDLIEMIPDQSRDQINCGSGVDLVSDADRFDRLQACP